MPAVARIGDKYSCGDTQKEGSGNVFVNAIPVARLGDSTAGHCFSPVPIVTGSGNVFVNGLAIARIGDSHPGHCCPGLGCHGGVLATGSGNVFVNG